MATSTIHDKFIIKDESAIENLNKAFENACSLGELKPVTQEEQKKGIEIAKKWLSSHSQK